MRKLTTPFIYALALSGVLSLAPAWAGKETERVSDGKSEASLMDLGAEISAAPKDIQAMLLNNRDYLARIARSLLVDTRVADQAKAAGYLTRPDVKAQIARETRGVLSRAYIGDMLEQKTANMPDMTALAKERYNAEKSQYLIPEAFRIAHILIAVNVEDENYNEAESRAKAEKILNELRAGGDFSNLAKAHSEDQGSASGGGELPWATKGRFAPPFEKTAFALKPGEVSGLVRTRFGFHIIKLLERRAESTRSFDEVKAQILEKLKKEYQNQERDKLLASFQGVKEVEITDDIMALLKGK
jgi:peptidyl-prolyl cis-trans isomerase C